MGKIIPFPADKPDVREMILDGKPEMMLSARGGDAGPSGLLERGRQRESPQWSPPLLRVHHHARLPWRSECCLDGIGQHGQGPGSSMDKANLCPVCARFIRSNPIRDELTGGAGVFVPWPLFLAHIWHTTAKKEY